MADSYDNWFGIRILKIHINNIDYIEISLLIYVLAGIGFWSSLVFYNAFLPEIADEKDHDQLSAKGFSMGYFGSVLLFIIYVNV